MLSRLFASTFSSPSSNGQRRRGVDVKDVNVVNAFDLLPHRVSQLITNKAGVKTHVLLPYSTRRFKATPRWAEASKFACVVSRLLDHTKGFNLTHSSATRGINKYVQDASLGNKYDGDAVDKAAYTVRAVIAQSFNHRDKACPSPPKRLNRILTN